MALRQYDLQVENGNYKVTHKVVDKDKDNRVQFTASYPEAAIRFETEPPFTPPPKTENLSGGVVIMIPQGKTTGPFMVQMQKGPAARKGIHFDCGGVTKSVPLDGTREVTEFTSYGRGDDIPPPDDEL